MDEKFSAGATSGTSRVPTWVRLLVRSLVTRAVLGVVASQHHVVRGDSMRPAFHGGERLLVDVAAYAGRAPRRGDVVVVRDPRTGAGRYLKRVVGLPGEVVRIADSILYVNGAHVEEPYLGGLPASLGLGSAEWRLGASEVFVMGDNRSRSTDSRHFGAVAVEQVVGRAWFRYWPVWRFGRVR